MSGGGGAASGLSSGLGGAATGAGLGTMIFPGVGTAVGAGLGGALGLAPTLLGMDGQPQAPGSNGASQQSHEQQMNNALMQRGALSDYLLAKGNEYLPSIK